VPVAPVYNPSYSGGWDEEDGGSRPGWDFILMEKSYMWWHLSSQW
jgi:hypothetical protein